jgi:type II secretory pathway pseudopilin PulG
MPDESTVCPQCATPVQNAPTPPPPQAGAPASSSSSAFLNPPGQGQNPPQAPYPPQAQQYRGQYQQPTTDGGAVTSLVLGITSFVLCLSFFTGIPAIIVGHISWSRIRRSAGRLKGEGMALAGLILGYCSLPFILIVAAIAIPNLLRAKISANESVAMGTVRTVNTLQVAYETTYPTKGYAPDMATLGNGPSNTCTGGGTAEHACLLEGVLGSARCTSGVWCTKGGYRFTISSNCSSPSAATPQEQQGDEGACKEFVMVATPLSTATGTRSYCSISDAIVRYHSGLPLTRPPTADECGLWPPIT